MAKLLPQLGVIPGLALDLTTRDAQGEAWDFDRIDKRVAARKLIDEQKLLFVIGSPVCTAFCLWQRINNQHRDPQVVAKEWANS